MVGSISSCDTKRNFYPITSYGCPVQPYRGPYGTRPSTSDPSATLLAVRATNAPDIQHEPWAEHHRLGRRRAPSMNYGASTAPRATRHAKKARALSALQTCPGVRLALGSIAEASGSSRGAVVVPDLRLGAQRQCGGGGCRARWACSRCWAMRHRCPRSAPCPPGHGRAGGASVGNGPEPTTGGGGRAFFRFCPLL